MLSGLRAYLHISVDRLSLVVAVVFAAGLSVRLWYMVEWRPAFFGFIDARAYIAEADGSAYDAIHPAGYAGFLRFANLISANLAVTIGLQHLLGMATAGFLYLAVVRATGSRWLGLVPAAVVLFDGAQLTLEHTLLSEAFFTFLVVAALYLGARSLDGGSWAWPVLAGGFAAAAGLTRSSGLLIVPLLVLCVLVWRGEDWRQRLVSAGVVGLAAMAVFACYLVQIRREDRPARLSPSGGRILYSRVAPFADCKKFAPPAGTRVLCETTPKSPFTNYYLYDPASPAIRAFGPPGSGESRVRSFALAAIVGQPLDYLSAVVEELKKFTVDGDPEALPLIGLDRVQPWKGQVRVEALKYYTNVDSSDRHSGALTSYARFVLVDGWLTLLFLILPAVSLVVARERTRRFVVMFASTGWLLILSAAATANYDARYAVVAMPALAAATTPALHWFALLVQKARGLGRSSALSSFS